MYLVNVRQHKSFFILMSCIGHMMAFLLFGSYVDFSKAIPKLGEAKSSVLTSYLYTKVTSFNKPEEKREKAEQMKVDRGIQLTKVKQLKREQATMPTRASGNEQAISQLVALLHAAIQKKQHYPESAMEMQREGRVKLMFTLFKNGTITQLRIVQSSGTASLDAAAFAAVNEAVPFQQVEKFLKDPQEYQIDVVFELA